MLIVTVEIASAGHRRILAEAKIGNLSDLADVSDYGVYVVEGANPLAARRPWEARGVIEKHDRRQTVWGLVEKVAKWAREEAETRF